MSTTLVGMCTREQVAANVQAALEGLGVVPSPEASRGIGIHACAVMTSLAVPPVV